MDYHFEHHLYPKIPYYNLRKMHRTLSEAGLFEWLRTATGHAFHTDNYLQTYATMMTGG
jgi:fatty acid desaturase